MDSIMKKNILVIGSANIDMVVKTNRFPDPGETMIGGEFFQIQGGKGANQAVAAARLGGNVNFVARVGKDDFGVQAVNQYQKDQICTDYIKFDDKKHTGVALITVNSEGENKIIVAPGANLAFTEEDIYEIEKLISEAEIVLMQLEIPIETVGHILKIAHKYSTKVILNPAPAQPLPEWYYKDLFLITPNKTEVEQLTNLSIDGHDSMLQAANKLKSFGVKNIIITLGTQGAYLLTEDYNGLIPATKVKAVDTTGAGDVFNGALATALTNGKDWENSVRFACDAAALSVTKIGAQDSAPNLQELINLSSSYDNKPA
jgi:ribokinase